MINLIKNAYLGSEKLSQLREEDENIEARGIFFDRVSYFDTYLLEQIKPELASYLKEMGIHEKSLLCLSDFEQITSLNDLEDLDLLISAFTAANFIQNGFGDAYHNIEAIEESNYSYLTTTGINIIKAKLAQLPGSDEEKEILSFFNFKILKKVNFPVNNNILQRYLPAQKKIN